MSGKVPQQQVTQSEQDKIKELKKVISEQAALSQNLLTSAFQLSNYYLVFQGVILTAISHTSSLECSDAWLIMVVSSVASVLNLGALICISVSYVRAQTMIDETWAECNKVQAKLDEAWSERNKLMSQSSPSTSRLPPPRSRVQLSDCFSPRPNNYSISNEERSEKEQVSVTRRDGYAEKKRKMIMIGCLVLFLAFGAVMLVGARVILCKHHKRRVVYKDLSCLKLCDGFKCMFMCNNDK